MQQSQLRLFTIMPVGPHDGSNPPPTCPRKPDPPRYLVQVHRAIREAYRTLAHHAPGFPAGDAVGDEYDVVMGKLEDVLRTLAIFKLTIS